MCPPGYHHNGFVATHALGHMMYGYTSLVPMNQRALKKLLDLKTKLLVIANSHWENKDGGSGARARVSLLKKHLPIDSILVILL